MTLRAATARRERRVSASDRAAYSLTDSGNAEYFAARFGQEARYDHRRRQWLRWHPPIWKPDADREVLRLMKRAVRERYDAAPALTDASVQKAAAWALKSLSRDRLEAALVLAAAEQPIADAGDAWDAAPVFACPNGVLELQSRRLRPGEPNDRLTMMAGAPYDDAADAPRWAAFVDEIFDGDAELTAFVQRAVGYSLTSDTREQVFFVCFGSGSNGKSTFTDTIASVLGDYAYAASFATFELHQRAQIPTDLATIAGRRFVIASETNPRSRLNESRIKAITGGDRLNARHLYSHAFEFYPVCKLWLAVNHRPTVTDDSFGFWRRVRLIPFTRTFAGSADDKTLKERLRAEASGILRWAVDGCAAWQREGLNPPPSVVAAVEAYQHASDPIADFLDECCMSDAGAQVRAADLYSAYGVWCDRAGERSRLSMKRFGEAMRRHAAAGREGGSGLTVYLAWRLRSRL